MADLTFHGTFGDDPFGRIAEKLARFFGTPRYIIAPDNRRRHLDRAELDRADLPLGSLPVHPAQSRLLDAGRIRRAAHPARADPSGRPRQAARRDDRQKHTRLEEAAKKQTDKLVGLLESNTALTQQDKDLTDEVAKLTREIHELLTKKQ